MVWNILLDREDKDNRNFLPNVATTSFDNERGVRSLL